MEIINLLGSVLGLAMVSGINLYATVLTVGLGIRYDFIHLPPHLESLSILAHPYIVVAAALAYTLEFFADKIPWVDSLWDSIHTFIRPIGAAVIGIKAIGNVDPVIEVLIFLLCGGIALSSHFTKASIRLAANHSPEPLSNVSLSIIEDVGVVGGTWLAVKHPAIILLACVIFLTGFVFFAPKVFRLIRMEFFAIIGLSRVILSKKSRQPVLIESDKIPQKYNKLIANNVLSKDDYFCIRCFSGKGAVVGKNYIGFLCKVDNQIFFLIKKGKKIHKMDFKLSTIKQIDIIKKLLLNHLLINHENNSEVRLLFTKDKQPHFEKMIGMIKKIS